MSSGAAQSPDTVADNKKSFIPANLIITTSIEGGAIVFARVYTV